METNNAVHAFAALAQETRLLVFRQLLNAGGNGMLAGELSSKLDVLPNTLSTNLSILSQAGLVQRARTGRNIRYFADMKGMRDLLGFLMQDCCGGRPELCQPILNELVSARKGNEQ